MPEAKKLFEALVRDHADMLMAYLRSGLGNASDVDDLFQETMIVAWRRLDEFDQTRSFGPWLRGIARRLMLAHARSRSHAMCDPLILDHIEARLDQLARHPADRWEDRLRLLRDCVAGLPEHYQRVVQLRYFQQQAVGQLSECLQLSVSAAKKRLQRARRMVFECLQKKLAGAEIVP